MPIYEYQCSACDHAFDELQKMDADPLEECPECAKQALVKLVSAPSFRLKGSGWYETDFKQDKRRNLADDGNSSAPVSNGDAGTKNGDAGTKSDTKSAKSSNGESIKAKSSSASEKKPASKSAE